MGNGIDLEAMSNGIHALFVADADLLAALGGTTERRLYPEKAPQDPKFPYAVYQNITGLPDPTFTSDGEIAQYQFSIFHQDKDQPLKLTTINDVIKKMTALYDDSEGSMTMSGYTVIGVTRGASGYVPTEDDTQQWVVTYEIMVEDN